MLQRKHVFTLVTDEGFFPWACLNQSFFWASNSNSNSSSSSSNRTRYDVGNSKPQPHPRATAKLQHTSGVLVRPQQATRQLGVVVPVSETAAQHIIESQGHGKNNAPVLARHCTSRLHERGMLYRYRYDKPNQSQYVKTQKQAWVSEYDHGIYLHLRTKQNNNGKS